MCSSCETWPVAIGAVRAAFVFEGPVREQVHRYKYGGEFARASFLGDLMFERIIDHEFIDHSQWDIVAHVPLHRRRRRARGFDQAEMLARRLAERLNLPVTTNVTRVRDTPTQVGLGELERRVNMLDAFRWDGPNLAGGKVLLVDDVVTTGSTMLAATLPMVVAGAARVDGFALAREVLGSARATAATSPVE